MTLMLKVSHFQNLIITKYSESFPEKKVKLCSNDKLHITSQPKKLIRLKINRFQNGKTANSLHKYIKKELHKSASVSNLTQLELKL